jgi:hypothetical protein
MGRVVPPSDRSTVTDTAEGVLVSTPVRKNWFILLFLPVWLIGWAVGEVSVGRELLDFEQARGEPILFMVVWLIFWTIGGVFCFALFLWSLFGVENVAVGGSTVSIRREVLGVGYAREYEMTHARNLRVSNAPMNMFDLRAGLSFWGLGGGLIAFDYGSSTVRFGAGLEEAESARVVARILARFSSLRGKDA